MFRVLKLRGMETGRETEAIKAAEAALQKTAGKALQTSAAQTGHEELDDLTGIANQSSHNLDTVMKRWGLQGLGYIGNLLAAGRGDPAAAITAMPTYAKSAIVAETNMRTFGLNGTAIAAQENALKADMKSPIVIFCAIQIAKQQAVEARKAELTAGGAFGVPSILVQKVNEAGKAVNQSKSALHQAVRKEQADGDALTKAQALFHESMADAAVTDALAAAIDQFQKAINARAKAQKELQSGQQTLNDAQRKLADTQKQAAAKVDEQAKKDVDAMRMKLAEARAKLMEKAGEQGNVLPGGKQVLDMQDADSNGSMHMSGKSLHATNDLQNVNSQPPLQSVDLASDQFSLLANKNGSGIMGLKDTNVEARNAAGNADKPERQAAGAWNNPYSHMGIQDTDYQAYLDGKLTEADLLTIANAEQMYKAAGGSGNWAYMYQNEAHKRAAKIRVKYDPDYIKNDTYDYTHGGKYQQGSTEPMPNVPPFKTWTRLTTVDEQGGNQNVQASDEEKSATPEELPDSLMTPEQLGTGLKDGTIIDTIRNSPLGKAISKAIEPIKENVEAGVQLSDFFKQYDSSSTRVQTILADTRKKLTGKNHTAKDMLSIRDNARSAIDDTSMFQLIGNNVWYQDQTYPLYDPRNYQDGPYFQPLYTKVTDGIDISKSFDWKNALGSLALEDNKDGSFKFYTKGQGVMILLANALSIFEDNFKVNDVSVVLETAGGGHNRAYLKVGSSDRQKQMDEYAGTTQSLVSNAWMKSNGFGLFSVLDSVAALYESVSGKKADGWLDLQMTFDPGRKGDPCYAYIVGEEDGDILYASPMYPGDRLEIVDFWGKGFVYDLTDQIDPLYIVKGGMGDLKDSFGKIEKKKQK